MKSTSIIKMTAHEHYSGQILWISVGVGLFTLFIIAVVSDAALAHQARMIDVSTYFLIDSVCFLTAVFTGSGIYAKDFSNRGIAEIAIPAGMSRSSLVLWRIAAHALTVFLVTGTLFATRQLAFVLAGVTTETLMRDTFTMFILSSLKAVLALGVAAFLGCFTRPVISLLGTMALFLFGHFSTGISGLQGIATENAQISPTAQALLKILRIWNPNNLLLESLKGAWETPSISELGNRIGWGLSAIAVFSLMAAIAVQRRDVGALRT